MDTDPPVITHVLGTPLGEAGGRGILTKLLQDGRPNISAAAAYIAEPVTDFVCGEVSAGRLGGYL